MIYAELLWQHDNVLAQIAGAAIVHVPNLWWAERVVNELITGGRMKNVAATAHSSQRGPSPDVVDRVFVSDPRRVLALTSQGSAVVYVVKDRSTDDSTSVEHVSHRSSDAFWWKSHSDGATLG
jgi:hypothetical protein